MTSSNYLNINFKQFRTLQAFRIILASIFTYLLADLFQLNINYYILIFTVVSGILSSGRIVKLNKSITSIILKSSFWIIGIVLTFAAANYIILNTFKMSQDYDFAVPLIYAQAQIIIAIYFLTFFTNLLFWKYSIFSIFEFIFYGVLFSYVLSGHKNYQLDSPKQISSLTWKVHFLQHLHIEPQHLFILLGILASVTVFAYLLLATNRPLFNKEVVLRTYQGRNVVIRALIPTLLFILLFSYALNLNKRYEQQLSRASEGVGQAPKQGQSNLGFHKAVGQTNQPTALLRFEADYNDNPWDQMLYIREGALSEYNGNELVLAANQFDQDVPRISPGQPYISIKLEPDEYRAQLNYSIYLLTKHNTPPAIDYPVRISLLKNPDPDRFNLAYQVVSEAPTIKLDSLFGKTVGSPKWDKYALDHYLRAPGSLTNDFSAVIEIMPDKGVLDKNKEDLRYGALALKLAGSITDPLAKVNAIVKYLSDNSIYTRNPGHTLSSPDADPVAPYLFAEKKRGYCVHFAHSAVYMFRLLGIPARIGTGYLTDLSYAKDGHILLQMGDRHAWPEVYVDGVGWVVADIKPAQAENEQAPVPDSKLLEELMSKINPTEELIKPKEVAENEEENATDYLEKMISTPLFKFTILFLLLSLIFFKFIIIHAYKFVKEPREKARLAYLSFTAQLLDLGMNREYAETRQEFANRLKNNKSIDSINLTKLKEVITYSQDSSLAKHEVEDSIKEWQNSYDKNNNKVLRLVSCLNPIGFYKLIANLLSRNL